MEKSWQHENTKSKKWHILVYIQSIEQPTVTRKATFDFIHTHSTHSTLYITASTESVTVHQCNIEKVEKYNSISMRQCISTTL